MDWFKTGLQLLIGYWSLIIVWSLKFGIWIFFLGGSANAEK
jgi:hypothetical protein